MVVLLDGVLVYQFFITFIIFIVLYFYVYVYSLYLIYRDLVYESWEQ